MVGKAKKKTIDTPPDVHVRHCHGLAEFSACFDIQRAVWGSADADLTPVPLFVVAAETGGQVLGAFVDDRMVGFTLALAGLHGKEPFLHSHMTAVLDGWRDRGIGRRLKLLQREDALARGIERIDWSFDPLQIKNAYINLVRLGAIARRFIPNMYGAFSSPLQGGLPTDRLIAEWHLKSTRVKRAIAAVSEVGQGSASNKPNPRKRSKIARVRVPAKAITARMTQPDEALRLQAEARQEFEYWLNLGYAATSVTVASDGLGGEYVLKPWKQT